MKKTIVASLVWMVGGAHANELTTFSEVAAAVSQGQQINFVLDTKLCTATIPMPAVDAVVTPNAIVVVNGAKITASLSHFTLDSPTAPGVAVFDYSKYNIAADGTATLKMTIMNALSYEKLNSFQVNCQLGKGFKVFGH